ncbi:unnamed protein product [Fusarium venenatum]|uniref:Uncharacterized protein n=1 Tax=Fusarium venenatum TaxID=56646 RepID=A0A2L2U2M3_9HYPO|nr:uncharacterized protein FVRRES_09957 [Fusarium venenatum]CEI69880.1 unnamed protein product [Fusarium venenatum]
MSMITREKQPISFDLVVFRTSQLGSEWYICCVAEQATYLRRMKTDGSLVTRIAFPLTGARIQLGIGLILVSINGTGIKTCGYNLIITLTSITNGHS